MKQNDNAPAGANGGALPAGVILVGACPCANVALSFADRINAHGYRVARNPNARWRRRDALRRLLKITD